MRKKYQPIHKRRMQVGTDALLAELFPEEHPRAWQVTMTRTYVMGGSQFTSPCPCFTLPATEGAKTTAEAIAIIRTMFPVTEGLVLKGLVTGGAQHENFSI